MMNRWKAFVGCLMVFLSSAFTEAKSQGSLFTTSFKWNSDRGGIVRFEDFKGKWTVISMMYTSCSSSCPLIVQKIRKIETQMTAQGLKVDFILVTFDPERDISTKLKSHRAKIGVTEENWHFLSGSAADTRKLSMLLGIKFAKDPESGEFMHDNKIVLLSPTGEIKARLNSLGESEAELIKAISAVPLKSTAGSR